MIKPEDYRLRIVHEFKAKDIVCENGNEYEVETTYYLFKDGTWHSRINPLSYKLIPQEEEGERNEIHCK